MIGTQYAIARSGTIAYVSRLVTSYTSLTVAIRINVRSITYSPFAARNQLICFYRVNIRFFLTLYSASYLMSPSVVRFLTFMVDASIMIFVQVFRSFLLEVERGRFRTVERVPSAISPARFGFGAMKLRVHVVSL